MYLHSGFFAGAGFGAGKFDSTEKASGEYPSGSGTTLASVLN